MAHIRYFIQIYHKVIVILLLIAGMAFSCHAQEVNEKMVPVFIYNFTKYIEWPENAKSEFTIGIVGNTPAEYFEKMGKVNTIKGRKISIKKITAITDVQDCQIVYIPSGETGKLKEYVEAIKDKPLLLVSSKAGLIRKGADISLFIDEEDEMKTKFEINKGNLEKHGLKISKELLSLAYTVIDSK